MFFAIMCQDLHMNNNHTPDNNQVGSDSEEESRSNTLMSSSIAANTTADSVNPSTFWSMMTSLSQTSQSAQRQPDAPQESGVHINSLAQALLGLHGTAAYDNQRSAISEVLQQPQRFQQVHTSYNENTPNNSNSMRSDSMLQLLNLPRNQDLQSTILAAMLGTLQPHEEQQHGTSSEASASANVTSSSQSHTLQQLQSAIQGSLLSNINCLPYPGSSNQSSQNSLHQHDPLSELAREISHRQQQQRQISQLSLAASQNLCNSWPQSLSCDTSSAPVSSLLGNIGISGLNQNNNSTQSIVQLLLQAQDSVPSTAMDTPFQNISRQLQQFLEQQQRQNHQQELQNALVSLLSNSYNNTVPQQSYAALYNASPVAPSATQLRTSSPPAASVPSMTSSQSQSVVKAETAEAENYQSGQVTDETILRHLQMPEPFPIKLYRMLLEIEREGRDEVVSFTPSGRAFAVHDPVAFMEEIAPRYFKFTSITSFKRQLYLYSFGRVNEEGFLDSFANPLFRRGRPDLLCQIHREDSKEPASKKAIKDRKKK
jgi:hypothetical protein